MKPIVTETRTAIINAAHDAQIVVRSIHDLGEHDVLIKILSCNLCTSEYGLWSGARTNKPLPMTFGHEWAGEIIQVGEKVSGLAVGDFVGGSYTFDPYSTEALEGRTSEAPGVKPYDTQWPDGYYGRYDGCAEYLVQSQESIYKFENKIRPSEAGFLEPLATVIDGIKKLDIKRARPWWSSAAAPWACSMRSLPSKGRSRDRLELMEKKIRVAEQLGLEVIDGFKVDPVEEVRARTDGRGADSVILAVAATAANKQGFAMLKKLHGKVLMFAAGYPAPEVSVDANKIHYGKMQIFGTFLGEFADFKESCHLLGSGEIDVSPLVDKEYPFDQIQQAFENAIIPGGYRTTVVMQ